MERETKLMLIEHQWKYKTITEAEKEAEAIRAFTARLSQKNGWACKAIIVASEHRIESHKPVIESNGKKGRPIKRFIPKNNKYVKKVQPHLHIIALANPAETLTSKIVQNINKRHRKKYTYCRKRTISFKREVYGDQNYYIGYVMHQMTSYRAVDFDEQGILDDFDFKDEYERAKPKLF